MESLLVLLLFAPILAVMALVAFREAQARRRQDALLSELRSTPNWIRIYLSRPAYFARWFKLMPHEARGVLVDEGQTVRVLGELADGSRIDHRFQKRQLKLRWLGVGRLCWIEIGDGPDVLNVCADTGVSHYAQTREASADILRRLAPDMELPPSARGDFAIEKNRRSLIVVCALFVVLAYAVLDGLVFNDNALLDGDSLMTTMPFVTLLGLACFPYLKRGGVPSRESWALSMFLGLALAAAFVPLVKRADQWSSRNSTVTVVYELKSGGRFVAVDGVAPALNYSRYPEYWRQFEPGSLHQFQLIHGPLGFWQLREGDVSKRLRDFYEKGGTGG